MLKCYDNQKKKKRKVNRREFANLDKFLFENL